GGGGSGHARQTVRHHPARQTRGGCVGLSRLGAVVAGSFFWPASDVGTAGAGGFAGAQPRAVARRWSVTRYRPVTRYLVDTNVISATAPTTGVRRAELIAWMDSHSPDLFLSA